ncbi:MAG TPA: glycosyltransferase, partial [Usitatibacter sp.]
RVELRGFSEYKRLLEEYNDVDVVLDAFPYNGGVTTLEAMWMGRPVVTIRGETMVSRQGVALLSAVGLDDLVATDAQDFARIVASLANDGPRRLQLASELRERMRRSPLMDAAAMARALESAYRGAWQRFLA